MVPFPPVDESSGAATAETAGPEASHASPAPRASNRRRVRMLRFQSIAPAFEKVGSAPGRTPIAASRRQI